MKNDGRMRAAVAMAGIAFLAACVAASADSAGDLAGVWGSERTFGPGLRGAIEVARLGKSWRASIGAVSSEAAPHDSDLRFLFPPDRGELRVRLDPGRIPHPAFWIQPARRTDGVRYATPVVLRRGGKAVFRGEVEPLPDAVRLFLVIQQSEGVTSAFFRSPERNEGLHLGSGKVTRDGNALKIAFPGQEVAGRIDPEGRTISLITPFFPESFAFRRGDPESAGGFAPRVPEPGGYVYRRPAESRDGWKTATPEEEGLDPAPLRELVERILATRKTAPRTMDVQGLLVARHGKLVLEEYFDGFSREAVHDMRSASKSVASLLVGIAIDQGAPIRATTPVYPLFPGGNDLARRDPRKSRITVENLLTMTPGWDCDDYVDGNPGNEDTMQGQTAEPDWYRYALSLPMIHEPGEKAAYCSAATNLLGGVIARVTGGDLLSWIEDYFARPLGIERYHWNLTPTGEPYMAGGVHVRPRDFFKVGQLLLSGGLWNGTRVVSRTWIDESIVPRVGQGGSNRDGYSWHIEDLETGGRTYRAINAGGNGGQLVIVIPELDLAVMFTGGNYGDFRTWSKFESELVPRYVIPAALSGRQGASRPK